MSRNNSAKEYSLTPRNLAILNLYEPFYELFTSLKGIIEDSHKMLKEEKIKSLTRSFCDEDIELRITDEAVLKNCSYRKIKGIINAFLLDYSYLFTEKDPLLCTSEFKKNFHFYKWTLEKNDHWNGPVRHYISFSTFLYFFELSVIEEEYRREIDYRSYHYGFDGIEYKIDQRIKDFVNNEINKSNHTANTNDSSVSIPICSELILYRSLKSISCNRNCHDVKSSHVLVSLLKCNTKITLPVHHCSSCGKVFIGEETLKIYESLFGHCLVIRQKEQNVSYHQYAFGETKLHSMGYNVQADGMSEKERHSFLIMLIDSKTMSPFEIIRDLETDIRLFETNVLFSDAVTKWKKDLLFVNEKLVH